MDSVTLHSALSLASAIEGYVFLVLERETGLSSDGRENLMAAQMAIKALKAKLVELAK